MADNKGAPQVQVRGRFGQVNQISLDTNRPSLQGEALWRAQNLVSFSTRGVYSDALLWILTPAVTVRLLNLAVAIGLPGIAGFTLAVFLITPPMLLVLFAGVQSPGSHGGAAIYRYLLVAVGLVLAIL